MSNLLRDPCGCATDDGLQVCMCEWHHEHPGEPVPDGGDDAAEVLRGEVKRLRAALSDVALRACQDRIASTIGRVNAVKRANFLRGALQRIQDAAHAAVDGGA